MCGCRLMAAAHGGMGRCLALLLLLLLGCPVRGQRVLQHACVCSLPLCWWRAADHAPLVLRLLHQLPDLAATAGGGCGG